MFSFLSMLEDYLKCSQLACLLKATRLFFYYKRKHCKLLTEKMKIDKENCHRRCWGREKAGVRSHFLAFSLTTVFFFFLFVVFFLLYIDHVFVFFYTFSLEMFICWGYPKYCFQLNWLRLTTWLLCWLFQSLLWSFHKDKNQGESIVKKLVIFLLVFFSIEDLPARAGVGDWGRC